MALVVLPAPRRFDIDSCHYAYELGQEEQAMSNHEHCRHMAHQYFYTQVKGGGLGT